MASIRLNEPSLSEPQVADTPSLCSLCQAISVHKMRGSGLDQMQPHQPSYLALKLSAEAGCRLCKFFCIALRDESGGESAAAFAQVSAEYPGREISLVAWGGAERNFDRMHIVTTGDIPSSDDGSDGGLADPTMHPNHQVALSGLVEIYTHEGTQLEIVHLSFLGYGFLRKIQDDPAAWHGEANNRVNGRPMPTTPGNSDGDFAQIEQWISTCCSEHSKCRKPDPRTLLPTRVIDVGPPDGKLEPKLFESNGLLGLYVTLSHCWGGKVPLTTTCGDVEERKLAIPLSSLPKTFRDAILVTRKLGIRYLWIDSLCILQDSASDWQKESAVMEAIYRNGYLNISARAASNSTVGCFFPRAPEPPACRLTWTCSDCVECSLTGSIYVRSPERKVASVRESPCDRRGWIFQEQLLSPRVLYYGSDQLYWECCEATLRQDGRLDEDALYRFGNFPNFKVALGLSATAPFSLEANSRWHSWWAPIVQEYARRHLTFVSDKLPAISGIAKAYQSVTGKSYVAGIWQEELPSALTWHKFGREPMDVSDSQPSWSWAKMNGMVDFKWKPWPEDVKKAACSLVEVRVWRNGNLNCFDNVAEAEIELKGHVVKVLYRKVADAPLGVRGKSIFTVDGYPLGHVIEDMPSLKWPGNGELYCILLHTGPAASGLLLVPDSGRQDVYRRVGLFVAHTSEDDDGRVFSIDYFLRAGLSTVVIA